MKVKAIKAFRCKNTGAFIGKGQVIDVNDERANELVARGVAEKATKADKVEKTDKVDKTDKGVAEKATKDAE